MAIDTRDYYRDRLRKKTRYVEHASFRMSAADIARRKYRRAWTRNFLVFLFFVIAFLAVLAVRRL